MRALVVTLKFFDITPATDASIEASARALASFDGLLSTCWLRGSGRIVLVQMFASHSAVNAYLDSALFAGLVRIPGCQDVFAVQHDVATHLNALSVLGAREGALDLDRELIPA
jgi:hypothetical protein